MASLCKPSCWVISVENTFIRASFRSAAAVRARSAPCFAARKCGDGRGAISLEACCKESADEGCIGSGELEGWNVASEQLGMVASVDGRGRPRVGNRPCKGQRTKFRRWREALEQRIAEDPFGIDLHCLEKPAFFGSSGAIGERRWRKVIAGFERLRDDATKGKV